VSPVLGCAMVPHPPEITNAQAAALRVFLTGTVTDAALRQVSGLRGLGGVELVEKRAGRWCVTEIGERALRCWERDRSR
jgi:hypothetical protein